MIKDRIEVESELRRRYPAGHPYDLEDVDAITARVRYYLRRDHEFRAAVRLAETWRRNDREQRARRISHDTGAIGWA